MNLIFKLLLGVTYFWVSHAVAGDICVNVISHSSKRDRATQARQNVDLSSVPTELLGILNDAARSTASSGVYVLRGKTDAERSNELDRYYSLAVTNGVPVVLLRGVGSSSELTIQSNRDKILGAFSVANKTKTSFDDFLLKMSLENNLFSPFSSEDLYVKFVESLPRGTLVLVDYSIENFVGAHHHRPAVFADALLTINNDRFANVIWSIPGELLEDVAKKRPELLFALRPTKDIDL